MNPEQEAICKAIDQRLAQQATVEWFKKNQIGRPVELYWCGVMHTVRSLRLEMIEDDK
jgi:hypothetical protein